MISFAFIILLISNLYSAIPPKPIDYVNDFANILDEKTKSELNSLVMQVEQKTSAEIAVVTISSLEKMTIEEYAEKLFKKWGVGKKGKDNGVLILVAPNERKMRIEVGYGIEPVLPDGLCGEIIRTEMSPAFSRKDYRIGFQRGVSRIAEIIERNEIISKPKTKTSPVEEKDVGDIAKSIATAILGLFASLYMLIMGIGEKKKKDRIISVIIALFFILCCTILLYKWIKTATIIVLFFGIFIGIAIIMMLFAVSWEEIKRHGGGFGGGAYGGGGGGFGGFGGFGGGSSGGGGASGSW